MTKGVRVASFDVTTTYHYARRFGDVREDAATALQALDIERRKLIRETLTLIGLTEVGILTQYPRRRDLVDAVLALSSQSTKKKPQEEVAPDTSAVELPA